MDANTIIRQAAATEDPTAHLQANGWELLPPPAPVRCPPIESFQRDAYILVASRKGWRGGTIARSWLTDAEIEECNMRAAEARAWALQKPIYVGRA